MCCLDFLIQGGNTYDSYDDYVNYNELMKIPSLPSGFGTYGELLQAAAHGATMVEV